MRRLFALLASLCALFAFAVPASAALVFNATFPAAPVFEPLTNPCNGEMITVTGNVHLVMTETATGSGGFNFAVDGNADGVNGTGVFGNNYQIPAWFHVVGTISGSGAATFTEGDIFNVISLGSAPNFVHEDNITFVLNPQTGIVSITASNSHDKCVA